MATRKATGKDSVSEAAKTLRDSNASAKSKSAAASTLASQRGKSTKKK